MFDRARFYLRINTRYVHLGGDEVDTGCWTSTPRIGAWMASRGFTAQDACVTLPSEVLSLTQTSQRCLVYSHAHVVFDILFLLCHERGHLALVLLWQKRKMQT
jgi:hypothetical protein